MIQKKTAMFLTFSARSSAINTYFDTLGKSERAAHKMAEAKVIKYAYIYIYT